jgi:hypothetical protein
MIDITGIDLVKFVQKVYELSVPQGLGFFHYTPVPLNKTEAEDILECSKNMGVVLDMDYINGRACKMVVWEKDGKLQINDSWYDHTDKQFCELLKSFGIEMKNKPVHGCACNCKDCQNKND